MNKIAAILALIFFSSTAILLAEDTSRKVIEIAIPDLNPIGDFSPTDSANLTELLITKVSNISVFHVLERQRANELFAEIAHQLVSSTQLSDAVLNTNMQGADALLLGSVGELNGRILLNVRLVDLQTGTILFADSVYTEKDNLVSSIAGLVDSIQEKGLELGLNPDIPAIERQIATKNWQEAKRLIDSYVRNRSNHLDDRVRKLYETIAKGLAETDYALSKRYVSQHLFDQAKLYIAEAIALNPDARFYGYRDTIAQREQEWQFKQQVDSARAAQRLSGSAPSFDEAMKSYFQRICVDGTRIGASYGLNVDPDTYSVSSGQNDWGLDFSWTCSKKPDDGKGIVNWMYYVGASARYESVDSAARSVFLQGYASPLLAEALKVGNLVISAGLDAGPLLWLGPVAPDGYLLGVAMGASFTTEIKIEGREGLFATAKPDWRWFPASGSRSGPYLSLNAGIVL
ncbi:MAG TPA: hypothetical protein VMV90_04240 [Rectinemataceae bacterium]|nr:hypothetical protein [Rectinemataceae bacterium]